LHVNVTLVTHMIYHNVVHHFNTGLIRAEPVFTFNIKTRQHN